MSAGFPVNRFMCVSKSKHSLCLQLKLRVGFSIRFKETGSRRLTTSIVACTSSTSSVDPEAAIDAEGGAVGAAGNGAHDGAEGGVCGDVSGGGWCGGRGGGHAQCAGEQHPKQGRDHHRGGGGGGGGGGGT